VPHVSGQINSVRYVRQAAYQPLGKAIKGQASPLSFAAFGARAFEDGEPTPNYDRRVHASTLLSSFWSTIRSRFVGGGAGDSTSATFQEQSTSHFSRDRIQTEKTRT
jgi:hypothetical protein